jgi:L,D-transpeptidase YbiS
MQLRVLPSKQQLDVVVDGTVEASYAVSTAKNGLGEEVNSEKTPRGWHLIRAKIGSNCPINTVFVGRRPTGEIYSSELAKKFPNKDWILTRILWLSGLELGKNRLGLCDTMRRFIYIHGSPDISLTGEANSRGCIRMRSKDIVKLFDIIQLSTRIYIEDF